MRDRGGMVQEQEQTGIGTGKEKFQEKGDKRVWHKLN
jgi:hypothetical protein